MQSHIITHLEQTGHSVRQEAKGRYIKGMIRLLGDLDAYHLLRDAPIRRLFTNAQLRKGKAFTLNQLVQLANPAEDTNRFLVQMQFLADREVFFRGYRLRCPECDLSAWYPLSDAAERVRCIGCRTRFQMPLDIPFAYRPNRLLTEGLKSGAMTILLTALWLAEHAQIGFSWESGIIVQDGGESTELDLIARQDDILLVAEGKDNFKVGADSLALLCDQLGRDIAAAKRIGATQFIFATLFDGEIPAEIHACLSGGEGIQTHLLTAHNLVNGV